MNAPLLEPVLALVLAVRVLVVSVVVVLVVVVAVVVVVAMVMVIAVASGIPVAYQWHTSGKPRGKFNCSLQKFKNTCAKDE